MTPTLRIIQGDALEKLRELPSDSVHCIVTSVPYWQQRDYKVAGQIGLEPTLDEWVEKLVAVFDEAKRVLHPSGVIFLSCGDKYSDKQRLMAPYRLALALQGRGWLIRDEIVWHKPAPMPESVADRCTQSWEPIFMLTKNARYFFDAEAIKEPLTQAAVDRQRYGFKNMYGHILEANKHSDGRQFEDAKSYGPESLPTGRNPRNVWTLSPEPYPEAHFATFPSDLPRRCILAATSARGVCPTCREPWTRVVDKSRRLDHTTTADGKTMLGPYANQADIRNGVYCDTRTTGWIPGCTCNASSPVPAAVCDMFAGSGTSCAVALELGRHAIGIELSPQYVALALQRCSRVTPGLPIA